MGWTKEQQIAIDQREANILVSAAAGSGKTAVLTERVLNRVIGSEEEEPIDIDRFLIVTFTSAAAMEMKERIGNKIADRIDKLENKDTLTEAERKQLVHLERQLSLLPTASISTIHSFCLKVIKNYFNTLDIDPNIQVAKEADLSIMKLEILEQLIEEKFEEGDEDFLKVAEIYGSINGMGQLASIILDIDTFSKSTLYPTEWLDEQVQKLCQTYENLDKTPWAEEVKKDIQRRIGDLIKIYDYGIQLCNLPNGPEVYREALEKDKSYLISIRPEHTLDELCELMQRIEFVKFKAVKKGSCDPDIKDLVASYRKLGKDIIGSMKNELNIISDHGALTHISEAGKIIKVLIELTKTFDERFAQAKREESLVDYNDLEHLCLEVLVRQEVDQEGNKQLVYTEAAKELGLFYKEVYIDEYQDSNSVQETLLKAIVNCHQDMKTTRFMVGDMKQSIYRFRLANPLIFAQKYETWPKWTEDQERKNSYQNMCIDLSQNFRSRENILEGVNDLFEQVMSKEVGDIEYDTYAKLKTGNLFEEGNAENKEIADCIELHILETDGEQQEGKGDYEGEELPEDMKNIELEAAMTAGLIDKLLKGEGNPTHIFDKEIGDYRRVEPRDIVILLRSVKDKANIFEQALENRGIGAFAEVKNSFFGALEIQIMISLMKIIDNPLQDIPLITILRSPIVAASYDDLVLIRQSAKGSFYDALSAYVEKEDAALNIKAFYEKLSEYREESSYLSLNELISKLITETGYYRYVSMLPTGERKKANLRMLKKYAQEFEESTGGRLFNFICYLDKLQETGADLEEAKLIGENENLVRIMTIHKSKGLEFGIVFLCDTDKKFNNQDITKSILLHHEMGFGPDYIDTQTNVRYNTLPKLAIKNKIITENISEEMRVLYVALTRAKEKLFVTGTVRSFEAKARLWSIYGNRQQKQLLPLGVRQKATYLNWIGMSLFAHSNIDEIRKKAQVQPHFIFEGKSKWKLVLVNKESILLEQEKEEKPLNETLDLLLNWDPKHVYGKDKEEIYRRLNFKYPYEAATKLPTKLSVSQIKKEGEEGDYIKTSLEGETDYKRPQFMQLQEEAKGTYKGTLIHSVFEQLDFTKFYTYQEIKQELCRLCDEKKLSEEALHIIQINKLVSFANSEIVRRMRAAKYVWKEKQFIYLLKASLAHVDYPEDEELLVQGIIDTFFIEEEGLVIIDYKSDYVDLNNKEKSIELIKSRYQKQLDLYANALAGITKMKVNQKYIYLYSIDTWIEVE